MFYLIGLGLDLGNLSREAREIVFSAKEVYLENYTVDFPYNIKELGDELSRELTPADRENVESFKVLEGAEKEDVVLLVYGSPLTATTHITLIQEAKMKSINYRILFNASVFDAVAETGLQLYKFGKIASMPGFEANSYLDIVKENEKMGAHTLILVDIGMNFKSAVERLGKDLETKGLVLGKIVACSSLGTSESKIAYGKIEILKDLDFKNPFCFVVPGKLHFVEEEFLEKI